MAMRWIRVLPNKPGRDINLPDSVAHRSVLGNTLILVPGQSQEITDEEWSHIKDAHADLLPSIELLGGSAPAAGR